MAQLYLHGRSISSVFQLLRDRENDMSYSLSWALTQCPSFLCEFTKHILSSQVRVEGVEVRMQQLLEEG